LTGSLDQHQKDPPRQIGLELEIHRIHRGERPEPSEELALECRIPADALQYRRQILAPVPEYHLPRLERPADGIRVRVQESDILEDLQHAGADPADIQGLVTMIRKLGEHGASCGEIGGPFGLLEVPVAGMTDPNATFILLR